MDTFARCHVCNTAWERRIDLLSDTDIPVVAYEVNFKKLEQGLFVFEHKTCNSQLFLPAAKFIDLYDGPVYTGRKTGTDECPGYCLKPDVLQPCPAECECAYIRELLKVIADWAGSGYGYGMM